MSSKASFHVESGALKRIRKVLIGVSLTEPYTRTVVEAGLAIADALGAKAHVVHCVWPTSLGMSGFEFNSFFEQRKASVLGALSEMTATSGQEVSIGVDIGAPYASILRTADDIGADLIVVGPAERPRRRLGSTAEKLMRKAKCPVLAVRQPVTLPFKTLLAPVDLSTLSADSFRCGLSFIEQVTREESPEIEVVFVLSDLQRQFGGQFSKEQVDRFAREELSRFVDENAGVDRQGRFRERLMVGDERDGILQAASESSPDLILLGTHGRGGVERALIGSVAAGVVRGSESNVLVIPPETAFGAELADAIVEQTRPTWSVPSAQPGDG